MAQPDMVGMVTGNMGEALRFYRLLGLDIPAELDAEDFAQVITPNGYRLSWNSEQLVRSFDPEWRPASGGQRVSLAFLCASPAEVDDLYARVLAAGFAGHKEPWDAVWGQRYAVVRDPDGNAVDLFAPLAG